MLIEGVNMVKMHRKARTAEEQSGIREAPAPVHSSNVMLLDPKSGQPTRTKARIDEDGTKERVSVKNGEPIPRALSEESDKWQPKRRSSRRSVR